jgi:outer membrane lipoprotein-sorting protein
VKKLTLTTLVIVFVSLVNIATAQTLHDILKKHFETVGQEKLMAAKNIYLKAKVNKMGMDIPMEMKVKRPDKFSIIMEVQGQKVTQVFDGEKGWIVAPGLATGPQELTGDMLEQVKQQPETLLEGDLYNYEQKGSTAEFLGKVNVNGSEAYRIKLTTKEGNEWEFFINANTYLIDKANATITSGDQSVNVEEQMSNYDTIDGITIPLKIVQNSPIGNTTIIIEDIRFDENFDDSIFMKPAQ